MCENLWWIVFHTWNMSELIRQRGMKKFFLGFTPGFLGRLKHIIPNLTAYRGVLG